jgi:hypothetical protein
MHPKLLIRTIRRPRLELLAKQFKHQGLLLFLALLLREVNLETENSVLLGDRYKLTSQNSLHDLPNLA